MEISNNGIKLLEEFEGLFLKAYKDIAGIWTIGYGTIKYPNGMPVKPSDTCTKEEAERWLAFEVNEKCAHLNSVIGYIGIDLNQNEYDAVASFIYNLGSGMLNPDRSFGIAIRTKDRQKIADSMLLYCKYRGLFGVMKVSKGLLNRRKKEAALFLSPILNHKSI